MVKPHLKNLALDCWQCQSKLGTSQKPSLCFYRDSGSTDSSALLTALDELTAEGVPSRRMLLFQPSPRTGSVTSLRIKFVLANEKLHVLSFSFDQIACTIEATELGLALLRDGISCWIAGAEDFGISARKNKPKKLKLGIQDLESGEIWFWGPSYFGP